MTKKLNFTKKAIAAIQPPEKGRDTYSDTVTPGLKLRVTGTGAKTFTLVKKAHGKTYFIALGTFPQMSIANARSEAGEKAAKLMKGQNPRQKEPAKLTLGELFQEYMKGHAKPHKKSWKEDQKKFDLYLESLQKKPVAGISRDTVRRLHTMSEA